MKKFQPEGETIPEGAVAKTYDEIVIGLRQDLIAVHEYSCASGDVYDSLSRLTEGQVARLIGKSGEMNYQIIVVLEQILATLAAVEKNADMVFNRTVQSRSRLRSWKTVALWIAVGAVSVLSTMGAGWVGGVRAGALVGYSRALDDLAAGGMIEMKRHGDWVDLTMGPSNPAGSNNPSKPKPTMTLDADKVPGLRTR